MGPNGSFLGTRWQRGCCSIERLILGAVALWDRALALQDGQEAADDAQGQDGEGAE